MAMQTAVNASMAWAWVSRPASSGRRPSIDVDQPHRRLPGSGVVRAHQHVGHQPLVEVGQVVGGQVVERARDLGPGQRRLERGRDRAPRGRPGAGLWPTLGPGPRPWR